MPPPEIPASVSKVVTTGASTDPMRRAALPDWYPAWARELADLYFSGTTCLFVLHGNVRDLILCPPAAAGKDDAATYCSLSEFLGTQLFGSWDVVVGYDLGGGLRPLAGGDSGRLQAMAQYLAGRCGEPTTWPRDPENVLLLLDRLIERNLLEDDPTRRKSICVVLDYAQYLVPSGDLNALARAQGTNLVRLLSWAQNPYIKRLNIAFCLVADKLAEVNDRLVQNAYVASIALPLPDEPAREAFVRSVGSAQELAKLSDLSAEELTGLTNGLSLVNMNVLLSQARHGGQKIDTGRFRQIKKSMIERECQGLVEFVEPKHTLDLLAGQQAAKQRLREDANLILHNQLECAPMGYLICGPVGTGKTFLAECYAGSIGIACVKLRNFRSKYVGETEGNLEQVLTVLRSLGPVVVIIDEADAALGNRSADGDSGTSSRVFSMISSQMGDTRYRGKIVWMLLTCRPDLLPIDLKRQGRAEVHIPLFYPADESEIRAMFAAMSRKNKVRMADDALSEQTATNRHLSGADMESVLLAARRGALASKRDVVTRADLDEAFNDFVPSSQGLEKEMQELASVLECTQLNFLPPEWREKVAKPDGRTRLQERMVAIRSLLRD